MEIKCEYCGSIIQENAEKCPYCGATNKAVKRTVDGTPKTIAQLQEWYEARNLPPYEVTRFFIGIDYRKPKAFGIYQDGNNFIVYKNKADGQRAVRYSGPDEAYAVNELYLKLKEEILNQKAHSQNRKGNVTKSLGVTSRPRSPWDVVKAILLFLLIIFGVVGILFLGFFLDELYAGLPKTIIISLVASVVVSVLTLIFMDNKRERFTFFKKYTDWINQQNGFSHMIIHYLICALLIGLVLIEPIHRYHKVDYYKYNDTVYVNSHYNWFEYCDYDYVEVEEPELPSDLLNNKTEYLFDYGDGTWNGYLTKFEDSNYYEEHYTSDDSDSDYNWDSNDSWDSNDTDWDSDW